VSSFTFRNTAPGKQYNECLNLHGAELSPTLLIRDIQTVYDHVRRYFKNQKVEQIMSQRRERVSQILEHVKSKNVNWKYRSAFDTSSQQEVEGIKAKLHALLYFVHAKDTFSVDPPLNFNWIAVLGNQGAKVLQPI
jgi:hypothetical protein